MQTMETILDGLPYVEEANGTAARKAKAEFLINDELSRSGGFLEIHPTLPSLPSEKLSPLVQAEFERIRQGRPHSERPKSNYKLLFPKEVNPLAAAESVKKRSIVAEMLEFQALNAKLCNKYAEQAYEKMALMMSNELSELKDQLQNVILEQNTVNAKRKKTQFDAADALRSLEMKFKERTLRCQQLHSVISHEQQLLQSQHTR